MLKRRPHRFTVRRLLALTTAVAAICAAVSSLPVPELMRAALLVYCLCIIGWEVFRGPRVRNELYEVRRRRRALAAKRIAMAAEVEQLRQRSRKSKSADPEIDPKAP
jgi:hypothetical protein